MKTSTKIKIARFIFNILIFFGIKKNLSVKRKFINWKLDLSEGIDLSIFLFGSFQGSVVKSITELMLTKNKENFDILDIGSNIGDKSLSLADKLLKHKYYNFKIFSIEPTDYAFNKQVKNINLNPNLKKKILLFKYFFSNKKYKPQKIYSSWKLDATENTHKFHHGSLKKVDRFTKSIKLDDFIKRNKIKKKVIIKMDVDGSELDILKSGQKLLKNKSPIIFMEYAPYIMKEQGSNLKEFMKFLKKFNYNIYDLNFKKLKKINISVGASTDIVLIKNM